MAILTLLALATIISVMAAAIIRQRALAYRALYRDDVAVDRLLQNEMRHNRRASANAGRQRNTGTAGHGASLEARSRHTHAFGGV